MSLVNVLPIRDGLIAFAVTMLIAGAFAYHCSHPESRARSHTQTSEFRFVDSTE